ncbi:IIGP5 GTPase, partial [Amia calva]|nr:IIGP5 GTPase [Amia calva]
MGSLLRSRVVTEVVAQVQGMLGQLDSATLDIAVTGDSGAGKSSFINAFRGLGDEDPESSPTGVTETTLEITAYPHPGLPNVRLWDLPGIGTPRFQADRYLKMVGLERFDFFIIVSSERFRENHVLLAEAVRKWGKKFYFVRNKVENDLEAWGRRKMRGAAAGKEEQEDLLGRIRADCEGSLRKMGGGMGTMAITVFLISCFHPNKFDFPRLQETLAQELEGHKRHALLLALPNLSATTLQGKRKALEGGLWRRAMSACLCTVAPGGLGVGGRAGLSGSVPVLMETLRSYQRHFGVDQESLRRLAALTGKPYELLCREVTSSAGRQLSEQGVEDMLGQMAMGQQVVVGMLQSRIPVLGSLTCGGVSFVACYWLLSSALGDLSQDAERVMRRALHGEELDREEVEDPGFFYGD